MEQKLFIGTGTVEEVRGGGTEHGVVVGDWVCLLAASADGAENMVRHHRCYHCSLHLGRCIKSPPRTIQHLGYHQAHVATLPHKHFLHLQIHENFHYWHY